MKKSVILLVVISILLSILVSAQDEPPPPPPTPTFGEDIATAEETEAPEVTTPAVQPVKEIPQALTKLATTQAEQLFALQERLENRLGTTENRISKLTTTIDNLERTITRKESPSFLVLSAFVLSLLSLIGVGILVFIVLKRPKKTSTQGTQRPTSDLKSYIVQALQKGYTIEDLTPSLTAQGWTEEQVRQAYQEAVRGS